VCYTVDEIYHLAAPASPFHILHNPIKTIKTNTVGTANMLGMKYDVFPIMERDLRHCLFVCLFVYLFIHWCVHACVHTCRINENIVYRLG